jgi:hypothetical protein
MDYLLCILFGFVAGFTFAFEIVAVILTVKPESPAAGTGSAEDFA